MMNHRLFLTLLALLLPLAAARGQRPETAAEKSPGPPAAVRALRAESVEPAREAKTRKVPLVGIASTEALPEQRSELGLPEGVGLVVQYVGSGTPAAEAGLKRLDVLHKLNDQILVNNPQFRVLVRTFKPGERIALGVFREGKPLDVEVRLGETLVPVNQASSAGFQWTLIPAQNVDPAGGSRRFYGNYKDRQHVLGLRADARGKEFLARDLKGKVLFFGYVNTTEQRREVPEAIRPKLERLETPPKPEFSASSASAAGAPPTD